MQRVESGWQLACPACRAALGPQIGLADDPVADRTETCACGALYRRVDGIWRLLRADREPIVERFVEEYSMIRRAEGRGSDDASYYLGLPKVPPNDPLAGQWKLRARTWRHVRRRVLPRLAAGAEARMRIVDLGAGVGWLSHRFHDLGHAPFALDLSLDDRDGLGAARHYPERWPRAQAEFDRIPLTDEQADIVVFNASLHYSESYEATLTEALRVLVPGGHLVVLETPVYRNERSGRQMLAERQADFERRFGTRSDSVRSAGFLTDGRIVELGSAIGVQWSSTVPWFGWAWWWRPHRARLRGEREPSRFPVLVARPLVPGGGAGGGTRGDASN